MADRCNKTTEVHVRPIYRSGESDLTNAEVLCDHCYFKKASNGVQKFVPNDFSNEVKNKALWLASFSCECTVEGCH